MSNSVVDEPHGSGDTSKPEFSLLVITYNRPQYLSDLIASLNRQRGGVAHELVVIDNGSDARHIATIESALAKSQCPTTLRRFKTNLHSALRWAEGAELASGTFLLTPGDDDVLRDGYLESFQQLARNVPKATLLSGGLQYVDESGSPTGKPFLPSTETNQAVLLAQLIERPIFAMPSSGVRRSAVNFFEAPRARTTIDWWMWFQCVYNGPVASTTDLVVNYRQHAGQDARRYSARANLYEAARFLMGEIESEHFSQILSKWTREELQMFTKTLLGGPGPMFGDPDLGPLVQMTLAEKIAKAKSHKSAADLFAQSCVQAGVGPSVGYLQTLTANSDINSLPSATWSRSLVNLTWLGTCDHLTNWRKYLGADYESNRAPASVLFRCTCESGDTPHVEVQFVNGLEEPSGSFAMSLQPSERSTVTLMSMLDEVLGSRSLLPRTPAERRLIAAFRLRRHSWLVRKFEKMYRRWAK